MKKSNKKPTAHLICGFIGSGKTTYAKKLAQEISTLRLTKDEWMIRIFGHNPKKIDEYERYDKRMTQLTCNIALECLKSGNDVIIDDGFWFKSQRLEIYNQIAKLDANYKLYYIKCSDEIMKQRTLIRSINPSKDSFIIDESMFDSYKKYFEKPEIIEEHILIEND